MKKFMSILCCFTSFTLSHATVNVKSPTSKSKNNPASSTEATPQPERSSSRPATNPLIKKPKIVILTSTGGNGHMAACATLQSILPNYEIKLVYPIYDIFHHIINGEKSFYGNLLQNGWIRTLNFFARYPGSWYFKMHRTAFKELVLEYLDKEKPDLLISVIPYINYPAVEATKLRKIPFMLITLDADLTLWLLDMDRCTTNNYTITVPTKTPLIEKQLKHKHIPASCVHEIGKPQEKAFGCPLRSDFFIPKDTAAIKKEWNIPEDKKVILMIRGGTGSAALIDYTKTLMQLKEKLHLLVCIGKNIKLADKLNQIKQTGSVSFTVIPFTKKIPDLMAVSDLLISQPSPNVCNEALFMHLPILIDMTGPCLFWEKATIDWIKLYGSGDIFKRMKQLKTLVPSFINKKQMQKLPQSVSRFNDEICKLVNAKISLTT